LYQEGLIELDETVKLYPDFQDEIFSRYYKTRLISRLRNLSRYHTQQSRDWQNTVLIYDLDQFIDSKEQSSLLDADYKRSSCWGSLLEDLQPSPEEEYQQKQRQAEAEKFIQEVKDGLDDEAQWVFDELLYGIVPEQLKAEFKRVPSHMSITVLGLIFGWDRAYTWRVVKRVRRRAKVVISRYRLSGNYLLWSDAA
jgi:hypothetical protein